MTENFPGPMAGKTALVTGGTGGIGRATAAGLAAPGRGTRSRRRGPQRLPAAVSSSWPLAGRFRWPPTLERRDVGVGDHYIADRKAVGELVTPKYDGLPVLANRAIAAQPAGNKALARSVLVRSGVNRYAVVRRISFIWPAAAGMYHTHRLSPLSSHQARVSGPPGEGGTAPAAGAARLKADPCGGPARRRRHPRQHRGRDGYQTAIDADHRRNS